MLDLSPEATTFLIVATGTLLLLLLASFLSRARVFTQYLEAMAGIKLSPREVARIFKARGKAGVRDMFLDLIIREDLRDSPRITPDSAPDTGIVDSGHRP